MNGCCESLVTCRCGLRHAREMECPICSAPRGDVELVLRLPRGGANAERVARLVSDLASIVGASVVVRRAGSDRVTRIGPQPMLCADCGADVHADWYIGRDGRRRCLRCHAQAEPTPRNCRAVMIPIEDARAPGRELLE